MKGSVKYSFSILIFIFIASVSFAEEGMWIPLLLEKYQIKDMQAKGCKLTAEEIYNINSDCLADAVVIFSGGCTGEVISAEGLILTNYHCADDVVSSHTTLENNLLKTGFWAMSREEELPNEDLTVTFLRGMEDVTGKVLEDVSMGMEESLREKVIGENIRKITKEAMDGNDYRVLVKPFYHGNQYFLFMYEVFRDIRLVGTPPESIGNFGKETDNWIWPRHTGDFMLFRIYADKDNRPAEYDPGNVPYTPEKHLTISLRGVEEGDFTMVLGFPGRTTEYLYSGAIRNMQELTLPHTIGLRTARLDIMRKYMEQSEQVMINYTSKLNGISNYWKKWKGMVKGMERLDAVQQRVQMERDFLAWMAEDDLRILKYDWILPEFERIYDEIDTLEMVLEYMDEAVYGVELFREATKLYRWMAQGMDADLIRSEMNSFYDACHLPIDREIFAAMMKAFYERLDNTFHPPFFSRIRGKYNEDFSRFAEETYEKTIFSSPGEVNRLIDLYKEDNQKALKRLLKDPIQVYAREFREMFMMKVYGQHNELSRQLEKPIRTYMKALKEMYGDSIVYPDANLTLRLTYGEVKGYRAQDAVTYTHSTTLGGVIEKSLGGESEYSVPEQLLALYETRDYGPYGEDSIMPVCFTATNHTTNGNSGSPVLDGEGNLIGINFDRNWEGTVSDIFYDPNQTRNISVDIRYVLLIIDKFAGAGYLLDEMEIIK